MDNNMKLSKEMFEREEFINLDDGFENTKERVMKSEKETSLSIWKDEIEHERSRIETTNNETEELTELTFERNYNNIEIERDLS